MLRALSRPYLWRSSARGGVGGVDHKVQVSIIDTMDHARAWSGGVSVVIVTGSEHNLYEAGTINTTLTVMSAT
jgi:hypothetical protein